MGLNEMMFIINTEESKDNVHNIFCVKLFQGGNGSPLGGGGCQDLLEISTY